MGYKFEEKKQELMLNGEWVAHNLTLTYGNTYELDKIGTKRKNSSENNHHRWIAFVVANECKADTGSIVESVTFHLHKSFNQSKVVVTEAPFILSRIGWGYFDLVMEVEFKAWTGLEKRVLIHELHFKNKGKSQSLTV